MLKILFVTPELRDNTGGSVVTTQIHDALLSFASVDSVIIPFYTKKLTKLLHLIFGEINGVDCVHIKNVIKKIKESHYDIIVVNHSFMGKLVKKCKRYFPGIPIITIFHNVESKLVNDVYKHSHHWSNYWVYCVTKKNEKLSVSYSNSIISLNPRDSNGINQLYGKQADYIIPICLADKMPITYTAISHEPFCLFVGSDFFANYYGIKWFIKEVVPSISIKLIIVGKGMEKYKEEFEVDNKVSVVGAVEWDALVSYYLNSSFIVLPIFDGSGMKTKTAEALMFGKTVIGTSEAFEGYEFSDKIGAKCNTAKEFIEAIDYIQTNKANFNESSRNLYLQNHSQKTLISLLKRSIISSIQ